MYCVLRGDPSFLESLVLGLLCHCLQVLILFSSSCSECLLHALRLLVVFFPVLFRCLVFLIELLFACLSLVLLFHELLLRWWI